MKMKDLSVFYDYGKAGNLFEKVFSNNFYYRLQIIVLEFNAS